MTSHGTPPPTRRADTAARLHIAVVAARWHPAVADNLIAGAQLACTTASIPEPSLIRVPGSFELPLGAAAAIDDGFDAIIALGVVIRGDTPHFDYVCRAATDQLARLVIDHRTPIGFGLLTCDTDDQARARAGPPETSANKGHEAATAAIDMCQIQHTRQQTHGPRPSMTFHNGS